MKESFMESFMNMKVKTLGIILGMAALALAQEPAAPAAQSAEPAAMENSSAEAVSPEAKAENAQAELAAETGEPVIPAAEPQDSVAPAEQQPVAPAPVAEAQPAPAAEPEQYGEMPAPVAVRGVDASAKPYYDEPAPAEPKRTRSSSRVVSEAIPMKFTFGGQGFLGTHALYANDWDFEESYSGIAWKAGLFAIIPLNEYMMGFKMGVLFDHSEASASYTYGSDLSKEANVKFKMDRISVPLLFVLKSPYSNFTLDFGAQFSVPVQDQFKYSYEKTGTNLTGDDRYVRGNADMIDLDYRSSMDFALLLGFTIKANRYMSFDIRYECGFSNYYEGVQGWRINELTSNSFLLGISFYAL